jgi:hypothetical protein
VTPGPKIETRWVCIAASNQTRLAAQLSSYFNDPGVYFPVFEFPDLKRAHEEVLGKDGYFTQIVGKRAATWINNSLARIQPERIILLGLSGANPRATSAQYFQQKSLSSSILRPSFWRFPLPQASQNPSMQGPLKQSRVC